MVKILKYLYGKKIRRERSLSCTVRPRLDSCWGEYSTQLTDSAKAHRQAKGRHCICRAGGCKCWAKRCWLVVVMLAVCWVMLMLSLGVTWRVKNQIFLECSTSTMLEIRIVKLWMLTSTSQRKDRKWSFSLKLLYVTGLLAWSQIVYKFIRKSPNPSSETNSKWLGENSK